MMSDVIVFIAVNIAIVPLFVGAGCLFVAAFRIQKPSLPPDVLNRLDRK